MSKGKEVILSKSKRFQVGHYETIGTRPTMEDSLVIYGAFNDIDYMDYFAVFDGHGGRAVSNFVADRLHEEITKQMEKIKGGSDSEVKFTDEEMIKVFHNAFEKMDAKIKSDKKMTSGATGLVSLVIKKRLYCANVGDSRAVLCCGDRAVRLSKDHKPDLPEERERIEDGGGHVTQRAGSVPRVNDRLAVSRSFGDTALGELVSAAPFVSVTDLEEMTMKFTDTVDSSVGGGGVEEEEKKDVLKVKKGKKCGPMYLLLACDGLWDVMKDREAAKFIRKCYKKGLSESQIAERLVKESLKLDTHDNVSVVLVRLSDKHLGERKEENGHM